MRLFDAPVERAERGHKADSKDLEDSSLERDHFMSRMPTLIELTTCIRSEFTDKRPFPVQETQLASSFFCYQVSSYTGSRRSHHRMHHHYGPQTQLNDTMRTAATS